MIPTLTLPSEEDASINYVFEEWYGKYEARYVQRSPEYAIVYLSSHTGCDLSCIILAVFVDSVGCCLLYG